MGHKDDDGPTLPDAGPGRRNTHVHPDEIDPGTETYYEYRYSLLRKSFSLRTGHVVDPEEVVAMLLARRHTYSMRYWRFLKAAVLHHLRADPDRNALAIEQLEAASSKDLPARSNHGSGMKLKRVPPHVAREVVYQMRSLADLRRGQRTYSAATANALLACVKVGLRPQEWFGARIALTSTRGKTEVPILQVENAKYNSIRANGKVREIELDGLTQDELDVIQNTIHEFAANTNRRQPFLRALQRELQVVLANLIKAGLIEAKYAHLTLYSARHQFAANAKSANLPYRDIAALLGHRSQKTASWHYARKTVGHGSIAVRPSAGSVAAVSPTPPRGHTPRPSSGEDDKA
jgi:integrase